MKKTVFPILLWLIFETVAVVLWQAKDNLFYLLNFSYIGTSLAIALLLFVRRHPHARRISQLLSEQWYQLKRYKVFDWFLRTFHIETVALMTVEQK